jgi:hypothetical protein
VVSGFGRRPALLISVSVALGLLGYGLWPRDEPQIVDLLNDLCAQLNQAKDEARLRELQASLRATLVPEASVRVSELDAEWQGQSTIVERSRDLLSGPPLAFVLSGIEVHLSGPLARVDADLSVTVRGSGEQRRELRRTRVRLRKPSSRWQIENVEVDPVEFAEPEARP